MITDGKDSYAVFIYQCGMMTSAGNAVIGFNSKGTIFDTHEYSGTSHANEIACINYPPRLWSNVIYPLTETGTGNKI